MSRLDAVLARIRTLPPHDQEAVASRIEEYLEGPRLTAEQWAEVQLELDDPSERLAFDEAMARLRREFDFHRAQDR